jgi:hypothetical protein
VDGGTHDTTTSDGGQDLSHGRGNVGEILVRRRRAGKLDRDGLGGALWNGAIQLLDGLLSLVTLVKAHKADAFRQPCGAHRRHTRELLRESFYGKSYKFKFSFTIFKRNLYLKGITSKLINLSPINIELNIKN